MSRGTDTINSVGWILRLNLCLLRLDSLCNEWSWVMCFTQVSFFSYRTDVYHALILAFTSIDSVDLRYSRHWANKRLIFGLDVHILPVRISNLILVCNDLVVYITLNRAKFITYICYKIDLAADWTILISHNKTLHMWLFPIITYLFCWNTI